MKYSLFIGRWQPFHNGHRCIIDSYVKNGKPVCVAIRDTPCDTKNPYTAEEVKRMIEAVYADDENIKVIVIPDIEQVAIGRKVGYGIVQVPDEIEGISATDVRKGKIDDVPIEVQQVIEQIEQERKSDD